MWCLMMSLRHWQSGTPGAQKHTSTPVGAEKPKSSSLGTQTLVTFGSTYLAFLTPLLGMFPNTETPFVTSFGDFFTFCFLDPFSGEACQIHKYLECSR